MAAARSAAPRTGRNMEALLIVVAIGLAIGAYAMVGLAVNDALPPGMLGYGAGLGALALVLHLVVRKFAPYADPTLLPLAMLLNGLGLVMIHRVDLALGKGFLGSAAFKQLLWTTLAVVAATVIIVWLRDHRQLSRYTYSAMAGGLVLLLLPLVPFLGRTVNGARIWIFIGPFSFQPSEIAKILLTIFFAGYLVTARDSLSLAGRKVLWMQLPRAKDLGPLLTAWGVTLAVLVFERDLGTSLLFFGLFIGLLYIATERVSWVVLGMGLFLGGAFVATQLFSHVQGRVNYWLHPFREDMIDSSTQIVQGIFGMASGGLIGTGLGEGSPYGTTLSYSQSDMIFAALGEELGLAGLFAILLAFALIVERGLRTGIAARDGFGKLFATGLALSMALQVFVVVGGITRVIPLTGLTLPFMAAGGSSLLANWMIIAILLRISDSSRRPPTASEGPLFDLPFDELPDELKNDPEFQEDRRRLGGQENEPNSQGIPVGHSRASEDQHYRSADTEHGWDDQPGLDEPEWDNRPRTGGHQLGQNTRRRPDAPDYDQESAVNR
ncbi:FtsW/RodA/SpoVE family cell cycle protein [Kineosporia babensis]|uniref:FtsW/RodA/SpoVE family cell cycle protein n=1 Tax=Kineosporia babensis TaxID=499548 RepID=A0A9X1NJ53_9ACTN|nr:FtsW/RodA/SpoVE family cell cycle protein [Kineosporia babensis]MCD5314686.1 FtsW/RodA/SpoVE family cell cycle protein [Kineosporia babensis]